MNADLDSIVFAGGDDKRVKLTGFGLPFKHGIADIDFLPGDVLRIVIKRDPMAEMREKNTRPLWQRILFARFLSSEY